MPILNYQYRLKPNSSQAAILSASMLQIGAGWNRLVRKTEKANRLIQKGMAGTIQKRLVALAASKSFVGVRAAKVLKLQAEGMTKDQAQKEVVAATLEKVRKYKRSKLAMEYALEHVQLKKRAQNGSAMGTAWNAMFGKYRLSWEACWKGTRGAPRKAILRFSGWIQAQIPTLPGDTFFVLPEPLGKAQINRVDLGKFFPERFNSVPARVKKAPPASREALKREFYRLTEVEFIQHRPLPPGCIVRDLKVTRRGTGPAAEWFLTVTVEVSEEQARKVYPVTGLSCAINPSRRYAFTLVGQDHIKVEAPGMAGEEVGRLRLLEKSQKKLRRLQRKLDRQRRANNPECFDEKGCWIKGKRATKISKGMLETEAEIRAINSHISNQRVEIYRKLADELLNKYDVIYLGDWKDPSPKEREKKKKKPKEAPAKKGEAMLEKLSNKMDRDNALGVFRQILNEKISRTNGEKCVKVIPEPNTTIPCAECGALTGPTSIKQQGIWTCSTCGHKQMRGRTAGYNILERGLRATLEETAEKVCESREAEGFSVKGGIAATVDPAPKGKGGNVSPGKEHP